ncbi:hypothetical protein B0J11DRAFT_115243 [Dendryphion nanum]|uniref:Uncharacterized protein n=1 Tax=Dendryphion nanum TaxID=256645 RepID=A0A9P9DB36_9PLEO|nr:hypothetical protein B0J11DRAFT_115243 [Dendryphion nanum]
MFPALQPSRPKISQQRPSPTYQQTRALHPPQPAPHLTSQEPATPKPRTQIEAMPPFGPAYATLLPPRDMYNSATRHPVFFTAQLRKPPFPIPDLGSQGWSPVANGYIMERERASGSEVGRTKL